MSKLSKLAPSQFYDVVHLKSLPTLLEVTLMHLFKACHKDGFDKINKLSNFKCSLVSFFNKVGDTANELGSKIFWGGDLELHLKQYQSNLKRFQMI